MAQAGLDRAKLEIEDAAGGTSTLECWFNPETYEVTRTAEWNLQTGPGRNLPHAPQFVRGGGATFELELLFDTGLPLGTSDRQGVRPATDALLALMEADEAQAKPPPTVRFAWGTVLSFRAVCTSVRLAFLMFHADGTPTRARAHLTLRQVEKDARSGSGTPARPQNPTTTAERHVGAHVVRDGDTLQSIAHSFYADPTHWRRIAEANGIDDPVRLRRGTELTVPLEER